MAQPLISNVPVFRLSCFGADNWFTAVHVLKRWKFIYSECYKQCISIESFRADDDARELRSMKV